MNSSCILHARASQLPSGCARPPDLVEQLLPRHRYLSLSNQHNPRGVNRPSWPRASREEVRSVEVRLCRNDHRRQIQSPSPLQISGTCTPPSALTAELSPRPVSLIALLRCSSVQDLNERNPIKSQSRRLGFPGVDPGTRTHGAASLFRIDNYSGANPREPSPPPEPNIRMYYVLKTADAGVGAHLV